MEQLPRTLWTGPAFRSLGNMYKNQQYTHTSYRLVSHMQLIALR